MKHNRLVPQLSVIIPAHNAAETLDEQLNALRTQEYDGDWEIIVVDNDSTDNTVEIVAEYQRLMPHLRLVQASEKSGSSYARNVGARVAQSDRFLFCDADDVVAPDWVAKLAEALEKHDFVAGAIEMRVLNPSRQFGDQYAKVGAKHLAANFLPYAMACNLGITRAAFETVGGFAEDVQRAQDVDLSWRLQMIGYNIHDVPEAVIHYRLRNGLWAIWKKSVPIGESEANLYKRFAVYGMPRPSMRDTLRRYKWLIKRGLRFWQMNYEGRVRWVSQTAICWGRLWGSLRYQVRYL